MSNILPDDFPVQRTFDQMIELFVAPEIERRTELGLVEKPLKLLGFQVVFYDDGRNPIVRLNEEVRATVLVHLAEPREMKVGDGIYERDIGEIKSMELTDADDPDCAHVTCYIRNNKISLSFDFRYNKSLAVKHLATAAEFLDGAREALEHGRIALFLDNLLSALELSARATLLTVPDKKFKKRASHKEIQQRHAQFVQMGNADEEHVRVYAELRKLRDAKRYVTADPEVDPVAAQYFLATVQAMHEEAGRHLA